MEKLLKTGPVVIKLRDFSAKSPWSLWQWKLEPFVTREALTPDISISFSLSHMPDTTGALYEEQSGFYKRCVYSCADGKELHTLEDKTKAVIAFSKNKNSITLVTDETDSGLQAPFEFLSRTVIHSLIDKSILSFHGVLLEHKGEGIIISAPSETGKTTHAHFWRDYKNAVVLNGDNACCCKEDKWTAFSLPWSGTSGECVNRSVPVKALVILERGEENTVERLENLDAFSHTLTNAQYPVWDKEKAEKAIDLLCDLLKYIPVYRLTCRPEKESADVLEKALEEIK